MGVQREQEKALNDLKQEQDFENNSNLPQEVRHDTHKVGHYNQKTMAITQIFHFEINF